MSYAAPAEHHPSDLPATCTYLGRDVEFISDAFSLSDDGEVWTPCRGGVEVGTDGAGYCAVEGGFSGPRCEVCEGQRTYFSDLSKRCERCVCACACRRRWL